MVMPLSLLHSQVLIWELRKIKSVLEPKIFSMGLQQWCHPVDSHQFRTCYKFGKLQNLWRCSADGVINSTAFKMLQIF
jgi:hypothetical protein